MSKEVSFQGRPPSKDNPRAAAAFAELGIVKVEPIKRLTVDMPCSLHARVKLECVKRDIAIAEVIRGLLEKEFPPGNE